MRKIPPSHGSHVTGLYPSSKGSYEGVGYESALERDCIARLDANSSVVKIMTQSVRISYLDQQGRRRVYTPDILVHYSNRSPRLLEVKPRSVLVEKLSEYQHKFFAAIKYAKKRGWTFRVVTERYIRGQSPAASANISDERCGRDGIVKIAIGELVQHNDLKYTITKVLDMEKILANPCVGGSPQVLRVSELLPVSANAGKENMLSAMESISKEKWDEAERKYRAIQPLIVCPSRTADMVRDVGRNYGVSMVTVYNWIRAYEQTGQVLSLLPKERRDKGEGRLSDEVEAIIDDILETEYLHKQRRSMKSVMRLLRKRLLSAGLPIPHEVTVRQRTKKIAPKKVMRKRGNSEQVRRLDMSPGKFPGAESALDVAQMDHSLLDIILVDSETRKPLGRPWLTMVVDVYSRLVSGFHISLDSPSTASAGACLSNAILPKESFLQRHRHVQKTWNCWGAMKKLQMDNAGEFRGATIRQACINRGINLEWRPVRRPEYGGHIERLMGTVMKEIHELPGSTFSSPQARSGVVSEKTAALTLSELEEWLAIFIVDVYNHRPHSQTMQPPQIMFEESILCGGKLPDREVDERRLRIDFLPIITRRVQRQGIVIDGIYYYHPVLEKHFSPVENRPLQLRRDPHDISHIFLFDKDSSEYVSIGYANVRRPAINIWELRAAQKLLKQNQMAVVNEDEIFNAYDRMRAIEDAGKKETKRVRRERERKIMGRSKYKDLVVPEHGDGTKSQKTEQSSLAEDILPFEDVEKLI